MDERNILAGHAFISYVREDSLRADRLQRMLEAAGIPVWRDTEDLWPGEDWRAKIRLAITDHALAFIVCFSQKSVARNKSYLNEELTLAIEQLRLRRPGEPWLIPVRFDECDIPDLEIGAGRTLASIQHADLFGERADESTARLVAIVLKVLAAQSDAAATAAIETPVAGSAAPARVMPPRNRPTRRTMTPPTGPQAVYSTLQHGRWWSAPWVSAVKPRSLRSRLTVAAVAFSPGGDLLASAGTDQKVQLWEPPHYHRGTLRGHSGGVRAVAFSPYGQRRLASASTDTTIRLWDPFTPEHVRTLTGHRDEVRAVAFSPRGHLLASASNDLTVRLWNLATGEQERTLVGHADFVRAVAFSPNGRLLASASNDGTVWLWDLATGEAKRTLTGHTSHVVAVAFSPRGHLLASAGVFHPCVRLWDPKTGQLVRTINGADSAVTALAFSPDGHLLAGSGYSVQLWDPITGREVRKLGQSNSYSWLWSVAFSPDGKLLAVAGEEGIVWVWR